MKSNIRKSNNVLISGVCAGIAEHIGWDPLYVRFIFAMCMSYLWFPYIILMWIMEEPDERP